MSVDGDDVMAEADNRKRAPEHAMTQNNTPAITSSVPANVRNHKLALPSPAAPASPSTKQETKRAKVGSEVAKISGKKRPQGRIDTTLAGSGEGRRRGQ